MIFGAYRNSFGQPNQIISCSRRCRSLKSKTFKSDILWIFNSIVSSQLPNKKIGDPIDCRRLDLNHKQLELLNEATTMSIASHAFKYELAHHNSLKLGFSCVRNVNKYL